ncbi:unnamed protein product [Adineta steineri]|uniref:Uncharacterized protein n=1 Tax=Adineta steineri TaxID=433720 RepID=A0A814J369_9BILA|nr:unnamed protein product [Adineta steineri]CAF4107275.1 unnamed protein product [Adineta steineri]
MNRGAEFYEFPYSGDKTPFPPFLNTNVFSQNNISSSNNFLPNRGLNSPVGDTLQTISNLNNNVTVYKVPGNIPLDVLLKQLGVDVNSLQRSSSHSNHYTSRPLSANFTHPSSRHRSRKLVCHEVTDSEDDDYYRDSSHHRRHHSRVNQYNQTPGQVHDLLNNVWHKASGASPNLNRANSVPNMNSQWQNMQSRSSSPMVPDERNAVANVWNQAANAPKDKPNFLSSFFKKKKPENENTYQPTTAPQQNQEAVQDFFAARNVPAGVNQPNSAVGNVFNRAQGGYPQTQNLPWNRMATAYPSQQQQPSAMNSAWSQMARAPLPPQQPFYGSGPSPAMNSAWNQMARAPIPPQQPFYGSGQPPAMNSAWNQMAGAPLPSQQPFYGSGQPPAMNSAWNQMARAPAPQQPYYPMGQPMNPMWNQMQQASYPPPNPGYSYPPMGAPAQGPNPAPAPKKSFFSMFSKPTTQQPYQS